MQLQYSKGRLLYHNALACPEDTQDFRMEGGGAVSFEEGRMVLENEPEPGEGQSTNFVYWCPEEFPADISIAWDFEPRREPGLAMMFFSAGGRQGEDLFDPALARRAGDYPQYKEGDINAFHVSYFRRKHPRERRFQTCNLRKSFGFHLVCQGADPIPSVGPDIVEPYRIQISKLGAVIQFSINHLAIFTWKDDGVTHGPLFHGGKIGFRQMAPLKAAYGNLEVHAIKG